MLNRGPDDHRSGAGGDQVRGAFRIDLGRGRTWWSPGVWLLHGLRPRRAGAPAPGVRVVIRHRHQEDRPAMVKAWRHLRDTHRPVCFDYRILGVDGVTRPVMVMAAVRPTVGGLIVEGLVQPLRLPATNSWPSGRPEPDHRPTRPGRWAFSPGSGANGVSDPAGQTSAASADAVLV